MSADDPIAEIRMECQKVRMTVSFNDLAYMVFMAGIGATISFAILAFSKRGKRDMRFALFVQSAVILGLGFLFLLGAGLASPPGYPHLLIPVVFVLVLALAHWLWRLAHPSSN